MEAAQRKVALQMAGIDKQVYDKTGKYSPSMAEEWDAKARARASANSEARMENHGRVHIGNGKYMDQSEIDAIALARMQPTFDAINEKTEKRLAEEEERRLELAEEKRQQQIEQERAAEIKNEEKNSKSKCDFHDGFHVTNALQTRRREHSRQRRRRKRPQPSKRKQRRRRRRRKRSG